MYRIFQDINSVFVNSSKAVISLLMRSLFRNNTSYNA